MKFSTRSAAIVAALAMATTGALALNQTQADASTIATTHSGSYSMLYNAQGAKIQNRALAANTPWLVGKTTTINGVTMYQVSTNEYLSSKDSTLNGQASQAQQSNKTVLTIGKYMQPLFRDDTGLYSNRALDNGSSWQVGKTVTNSKGETYYQVSTHEFVKKSANTTLNRDVNPQYVADFGFNKDTSSTDTNTNTTKPSTDTNTDTNTHVTTPSTDTNTDNGHTDTNTPSTGTDTNSTSINTADIQSAVFASINTERQSKGLSALTTDTAIQKMSDIRANDQLQNLDGHQRPDGSQWYTLYQQLGIKYAGGGENVAVRSANGTDGSTAKEIADNVMNRFRNETYAQSHYDNLIKPDTTKVGVSVVYDKSIDSFYIVEDFA